MPGINRIIFAGLLAWLAAAVGCCTESAGNGNNKVWCSFTDGKCSQWPEAVLLAADSARIKKIEAKSRAVYIDVFTRNKNPAGLEAAKFLKEHPEITFKTGLYGENTAGNWCVGEERAVYTDLRYFRERRTLAELAGEGVSFRNFVEGNAPFIAHELVHMRAFYERRNLLNGPAVPAKSQALIALLIAPAKEQPDTEWNARYRTAEEYLAYLVEQSYVGFETLIDAEFVSVKGAMGTKWRWEYYVDDPEKYCRWILKTSCSNAGLEDVKEHFFPETDEYYKRKIARQNKIRAKMLSQMKKGALKDVGR